MSIQIEKSKMLEILKEMMEEKKLIAQVQNDKTVDFLEVKDVNDILLGDEIAYKSPKEFLFPRVEKIIEFTKDGAIVTKPERGVVIFGVRPCDLEALHVLEQVFTKGKYVDPFFEANLKNTLLIGVGCINKKSGCFCDKRETNMKYSDKCDLFLQKNDENYEVLYVSDRGREYFSKFVKNLLEFENPPAPELSKEETLAIDDNTEADLFNKVDWESISETCQGCGMCTYICPTCHCFEFKDVKEGESYCRYRRWDSCMFSKFTLHASGHNPRQSKKERYRQRVLHKYLYVKENFGCVACTGCGRCVRSCPAGVNINNVVHGIMEVMQQ